MVPPVSHSSNGFSESAATVVTPVTKSATATGTKNGATATGTKNGAVTNGTTNGVATSPLTQMANEQRVAYEEEWKVVDEVNRMIREKFSPMAQIGNSQMINFHQADELKPMLNLSLEADATGNSEWGNVVQLCETMMDKSVKTMSPFFFQQLFHGMDPYGYAAAIMIDAMNSGTYTYDVGPVFSLVEAEVIEAVRKLLDWPEGGDGVFTPGGSMANMYGLNLARFHHDNAFKTKGMAALKKRPLIYTSNQAHYSTEKGAAFMGFGVESVVKIASDADGRMIVAELVKEIEKSKKSDDTFPLMVVATLGTTVLNAYDPIDEIEKICKEHGMWLHADACFGGAALLSTQHRHLLKGIERADSMAWCWHKVMNAPFQTSFVMCRHKGLMKAAHSANATYLFLPTKHYDTAYDTGDMNIQCGRRGDALKVWLMWKVRGMEAIGKNVDHNFEAAVYAYKKMDGMSHRFKMVTKQSQGTSICFWVIPPSLVGKVDNFTKDTKQYDALNKIAPQLKRRMVERGGKAMIAYQPLACGNYPNFFRITFNSQPLNTKEEIDQIINYLVELSEDL